MDSAEEGSDTPLQQGDETPAEVADAPPSFLFLLQFLESQAGREFTGHVKTLLETHLQGTREKAKDDAEIARRAEEGRIAVEAARSQRSFELHRHSSTLQVVGLVAVLVSVVLLAWTDKVPGPVTVGLLGSLAGYFAGKNSSG